MRKNSDRIYTFEPDKALYGTYVLQNPRMFSRRSDLTNMLNQKPAYTKGGTIKVYELVQLQEMTVEEYRNPVEWMYVFTYNKKEYIVQAYSDADAIRMVVEVIAFHTSKYISQGEQEKLIYEKRELKAT